MILINTTFSVDAGIAPAFIDFLRDTYIPLGQQCGMYAPLVSELRGHAEADINGNVPRTIAIQMRAPSATHLGEFRNDVLPSVHRTIASRWGMGVAMFESVLDVLLDPERQDSRK